MAPKMDSILSSTGSTKQAESCWSSRPAFINVGELGRNLRLVMAAKKSSDKASTSASGSYRRSA